MQSHKQIEKQYKPVRENIRTDKSKEKSKISRKERETKRSFS